MRRQRAPVNLIAATASAHALRNVKDDAREAVLVDKDLLVVGHLAQLGDVGKVLGQIALEGAAEERGAFVVSHGYFVVCLSDVSLKTLGRTERGEVG